jgi:lipopolysaccharide export LptBFGC system permease protein LptF
MDYASDLQSRLASFSACIRATVIFAASAFMVNKRGRMILVFALAALLLLVFLAFNVAPKVSHKITPMWWFCVWKS